MSDSDGKTLLRALSWVFGWTYFLAWGVSFYPQPILNFRRRSTVGATQSYQVLNIEGFALYSLSNIMLYYSETVRNEYAARHPQAPDPTVRFNDIVFAVHGLALSIITASQFVKGIWGYKQSERRMGKPIWGIVCGCIVGSLWTVVMAWFGERGWGWLDVVYAFGYCKMVITVAKYVPQAIANYQRKSTRGWAIWQVMLDLVGGVLSIAQLLIDSSLNGDWSGVTGNPVKFALGQVSIIFDLVFVLQHFVLYVGAKDTELGEDSPLLSDDQRNRVE